MQTIAELFKLIPLWNSYKLSFTTRSLLGITWNVKLQLENNSCNV